MYCHVLSCMAMYSHVLLRIAIYYPVFLCIAMCSHVLTMYVLSWNKVSELKSLFFVCYTVQGWPKKRLFLNEKIFSRGAQRFFRIVNGY